MANRFSRPAYEKKAARTLAAARSVLSRGPLMAGLEFLRRPETVGAVREFNRAYVQPVVAPSRQQIVSQIQQERRQSLTPEAARRLATGRELEQYGGVRAGEHGPIVSFDVGGLARRAAPLAKKAVEKGVSVVDQLKDALIRRLDEPTPKLNLDLMAEKEDYLQFLKETRNPTLADMNKGLEIARLEGKKVDDLSDVVVKSQQEGTWPDTTLSRPSTGINTSTGSAPTGKEAVYGRKTDTSAPFEGGVLYHGTDANFDTFDFSKAGAKGTLYGKGIYLTNSKDIAATHGKNIKAVSIDKSSLLIPEKPIPPHQLEALKKTLGEDYANWDTIPNGEWLWKRLELTHKNPEAILQKAGINGVEYTPIVKGGANYKNTILFNEKPLLKPSSPTYKQDPKTGRMQGSTKAIPKELEPLAAEARKYDGIRSVADGAPGFYRVVTNKIENGNYVTFQISANRLKAVGINSKEELIDFYNQATGGMPKGKPPFEAFGAGAGIETDEEGETEVDPLKAAVGVAAGSLLRRKVNVPDIDVTTPIGKLITAIRGAGKPTKALEAAQSAERSRRAGAVAGIFGREQGQRGFYQALGKLKGPLAERPSFEPVMLEQGDVDTLFNQVQTHPDLDIYDKVNASAALDKLLKGELPQRNQLALLEDIFGRELAEAVLSKRPFADKLKDVITEAVNVPRSLITSFDMSAPLRQGILLTTTKPRAAAAAGREMFRQVFSPQNFKAWFKELPKHPLYREMKDSGLYISDPTKAAGGLAAKEEAYMTNLAQKIPFVGAIVRASERAYVSYLNKLRVDVFTQLTSRFAQEGIADPDNLKSLAAFINNATGRGDLGMLNRSAQVMNNVFFSPRLVAARFQMLNPVWYARQTPRVRREAIKNFAQFVLTGSTVLALFKFAGADVETDPRSTDFGKIRIDNTRWDIWGGFQQWVRVYTQLATGERKTTKGDVVDLDPKKFPFESRLDVAARFLRGKLAPVPALSLELMEGQKLFGEELSVSSEIYENTVPLYIQDMGKIIDDLGPSGLLTAGVPAFFGVGVQNYQEKSAVNRFNR